MKPVFQRILTILAAACILLTACLPTPEPPASSMPTFTPLPDASAAWLQVYFTNPFAPEARYYEGGPDEVLAAAIDKAFLTVDLAVYNFNLWSIRDSLLRAQARGVSVRMVMDGDNMDSSEVQELLAAGIPIVGDWHEGLMHNKFVVIDRAEVWTGSMNLTAGGVYNDHNNLLYIRSVPIAENYTNEFNEMFVEDHFGADTLANTPHPRLNVNGTNVEVYFSPDDPAERRIVELLAAAQESIHFLAYSFTSDPIGAEVVAAAGRDLAVSGVMDTNQRQNDGTEYDLFRSNGLTVRLDGSEGLQHNKVIIIDEKIVITGSYNFTNSAATRNDENVVVIFDRNLAGRYLAEFQRIFAMSNP